MKETCPHCDSYFALPWGKGKGNGKCNKCHGTGTGDLLNEIVTMGNSPCEQCDGTGICPHCKGEGWVDWITGKSLSSKNYVNKKNEDNENTDEENEYVCDSSSSDDSEPINPALLIGQWLLGGPLVALIVGIPFSCAGDRAGSIAFCFTWLVWGALWTLMYYLDHRNDTKKSPFLLAVILIVLVVVMLMMVPTQNSRKAAMEVENNRKAAMEVEDGMKAADAAFLQKDFEKADELFEEANRIATPYGGQQVVSARRAKLYTKSALMVPSHRFSGIWSDDLLFQGDRYFRIYSPGGIRISDGQQMVDLPPDREILIKLGSPNLRFQSLESRAFQITVYTTTFLDDSLGRQFLFPNPLTKPFAAGHVITRRPK